MTIDTRMEYTILPMHRSHPRPGMDMVPPAGQSPMACLQLLHSVFTQANGPMVAHARGFSRFFSASASPPINSPPECLHPCQTLLATDDSNKRGGCHITHFGRSLSPTHPTPPSSVGSILSKMGGNNLPLLLISTATSAPTLVSVDIPSKTAR